MPSGNLLCTSCTLFQRVSRAGSERISLGMNIRMWLIPSTVDSNTGTTKGIPFCPEVHGMIPPGVAVTLLRSLGKTLPTAQ